MSVVVASTCSLGVSELTLQGGESKDQFWRVVDACTDLLPCDKPRYCMGVGYSEDLVICSALGVDMYSNPNPLLTPGTIACFQLELRALAQRLQDAARYASRTRSLSRIWVRLTPIALASPARPIRALMCRGSPGYPSHLQKLTIKFRDTVGCHLLSIHNIAYQMRLMSDIRASIEKDTFPAFVQQFMLGYFKQRDTLAVALESPADSEDPGKAIGPNGYPVWITNVMEHLDIPLL